MKKYSQLKEELCLQEGISDVLYHYTSIHSLEKIIETDRFEMTSSIGTDVEKDVNGKGRFFYMSTARSRLGRYSADPVNGVFIELDGRKLAQKYKGAPVDYWGRSFRLAEPRSAEMEDRIWSDKPYIENFSKYIKRISILGEKEPDNEKKPDDWSDWYRKMKHIQGIVERAATKNIEVMIYDDPKSFISGNKAKGKKTYRGGDTAVREKTLHGLAEILAAGIVPAENQEQVKSNFSKVTQDFLDDVKYKYDRYSDFVRSIKNDIHNNKKAGSSGKDYVNIITVAMHKLKLNSIEDAILFIRKQWHNET